MRGGGGEELDMEREKYLMRRERDLQNKGAEEVQMKWEEKERYKDFSSFLFLYFLPSFLLERKKSICKCSPP